MVSETIAIYHHKTNKQHENKNTFYSHSGGDVCIERKHGQRPSETCRKSGRGKIITTYSAGVLAIEYFTVVIHISRLFFYINTFYYV